MTTQTDDKPKTKTIPITDTDRRRIAHRMLDALLHSGHKPSQEICLNEGDSFESLLNRHYRAAMEATMQREGRWEGLGETWEGISALLDSGKVRVPGLILKADDFGAFDKREILYTSNGVAYRLDRGRKGSNQWLTVSVVFGYCYDGARPWWSKQAIEINPSISAFRCPLCGDRCDELFLTGHPWPGSEHFGCVPCTATLDPEQRKLYEKTRGKKKPAPIAQPEEASLVTV